MNIILKNNINVQLFSDKGRIRENNEDYCGYYIPEDIDVKARLGCLFAVADGVGSSRAGEVASSESVNVLLQEYYFGDLTEKCPDRYKEAFKYVAMHVYDLAEANESCNKSLSTLTALLLKDDKFYIIHIGDSKAFLLRDGKLIQMTKDQSVVGRLERMGFITKEQARTHPNRHVILHALGEHPILPPEFYSGNIQPKDIFFLCTDGIFEHLDEKEICDFFIQKRHLKEGSRTLIDMANERGGEDNMTIISIDMDS